MELRRLEDLDLEGKRVLLRLDLNVPLRGGEISDDTRIQAALPTVRYLLERAGKLAICSHLGRPKGEVKPEFSLEPVGRRLAELLDREVVLVGDYTESPLKAVLDQTSEQQFLLLENLRFFPGETSNDRNFAQSLVGDFDLYVNDAFGVSHRAHASVSAAAEIMAPEQRAAGFLIQKEVAALRGAMQSPKAPFTVIMGGAKVSDKIAVILSLLDSCNNLLVGGAMAYTFLKYRGRKIGVSRVEEDKLDLVDKIYKHAETRHVRIVLPVDHVGAINFSEDAEAVAIDEEDIPAQLMGLDIGPKSIKSYSDIIAGSQTVLWNGPMGVFEWESFSRGTNALAEAVASCSGHTIVGGGDSVAAVNQAKVAGRINHISTGGGASLEYLEGKVLPGLKVLAK